MKDKRIIEEMAKLEFGSDFREVNNHTIWLSDGARHWFKTRGYSKDHNAVQRVVDGMAYKEMIKYWGWLEDVLKSWGDFILLLKATASQKCEAILKAKGLWED